MHISIFLLFHGDGYLYEQSFPKYPAQHLQTLLKHTPLLLQLLGQTYNWAQNLPKSGHVTVPVNPPTFTDITYPLVEHVNVYPLTFIKTLPPTHEAL
jgi:hypothetical protein